MTDGVFPLRIKREGAGDNFTGFFSLRNLILSFRLCILYIMDDDSLVQAAMEARRHAKAPYSKFPVGAALLCKDGDIYTGSNIESSSFGLSICAERVALVKALSEGETEFTRMAVVAEGSHAVNPCGACLQLLSDYAPNLELLLGNLDGQFKRIKLTKLLPYPFSGKDIAEDPLK
jgi:cytidine deaminase